MIDKLDSMEIFDRWFQRRHEYAREWREKTGGKVIGYLCTYVPEELLYAADVLPVRIFGGHNPTTATLADAYIYNAMFCPFCRDCLAQGLSGVYDYVDGIVTAQSCIHMRQVYYIWKDNIPVEFGHNLIIPHGMQSPGSMEHFHNELMMFKRALEKWLDREISDEDVAKGIKVVNENRRLLNEIYQLRKMDKPPILGHEALEVVITSQFVDKREHNEALRDLLREAKEGDREYQLDARLLVTGSENDEVEFFRRIEEDLGLIVVVDEQCTGSRYFWNLTDEADDPYRSIARRYVERPICPSKDWPEHNRYEFIRRLAREWRVDGALLIQQKFCMPHELDIPGLKEMLESDGIKTYHLEFDVTVPWGQFQTRIEAFKEELIGLEELL